MSPAMATQPKTATRTRKYGPSWVSKTNLIDYVRCPYAFWLLDQGLVSRRDMVSEAVRQLAAEGVRFQAGVESRATPIEVSPKELPRLLRKEGIFLNTPLFENKSFKIYGRPDGIDAGRGALIPIEVKSHKDITPMDVLELAFYWLLLEPHRTRALRQPYGWLLLRRGRAEELVRVDLRERDFEHVHDMIGKIRSARKLGVRPRVCSCHICTSLRRDEVQTITRQNRELTLIWGIGPERARVLEQLGITRWDDLLTIDAENLAAMLRQSGRTIRLQDIEAWRHHARSYHHEAPVCFGREPIPRSTFIVIDLEYRPGIDGHVWLLGGAVVDGATEKRFAFWSEPGNERRALNKFKRILLEHPAAPIVTWCGHSADMPQLRHMMTRTYADFPFAELKERHLDLYQYVNRGVRLPISGRRLNEVARYFGIEREGRIESGLQAEFFYRQYESSKSAKQRRTLRAELLEYNRQDVRAVIGIAEHLRRLQRARRSRSNGVAFSL